LLLLVLLAGCAVGPYADRPEYAMPESRAVAARHLNEALAFSGRGVSEVAADELKLTWNEHRRLSDKRQVLVNRELQFLAVRTVARPQKPGEWWELKVDATGGAVTFHFNDAKSAAKAEAAMRRLSQPLADDEQKRHPDG
jgi:hypothetical protein